MFSRQVQGDVDSRLGKIDGYLPFTLTEVAGGLNLGAATFYPLDFVVLARNFGTFTISKTGASGTFGASIDVSCSDIGNVPIWIKGVHATYGTLIVPGNLIISDQQGFCE